MYQDIFEGAGNIESLLRLPYPLFNDIIVKQVKNKRKQAEQMRQKTGQVGK